MDPVAFLATVRHQGPVDNLGGESSVLFGCWLALYLYKAILFPLIIIIIITYLYPRYRILVQFNCSTFRHSSLDRPLSLHLTNKLSPSLLMDVARVFRQRRYAAHHGSTSKRSRSLSFSTYPPDSSALRSTEAVLRQGPLPREPSAGLA